MLLEWQVARLRIFKASILKSKVAKLHQVPADEKFGYVLLKWQVARLHIFQVSILKSKVAKLHQVPADENFGYVLLKWQVARLHRLPADKKNGGHALK